MRRYREIFSISLLFNDGCQFVESVTSILTKVKLSLWTMTLLSCRNTLGDYSASC